MKINTFGEFYNFITKSELQSIPEIGNFIACASQYNYICTCKKNDKANKHNSCNQQYINIVNSILPIKTSTLFVNVPDDVIEFSYNGTFFIKSISKR